jgi:hypothetical protein
MSRRPLADALTPPPGAGRRPRYLPAPARHRGRRDPDLRSALGVAAEAYAEVRARERA